MMANHFIIKLRGIVDVVAEEKIKNKIQECIDAGIGSIEIDCTEINSTHFDALQNLKNDLTDILRENQNQPISFTNLPVNMSLQCQLLGWDVKQKGVYFNTGSKNIVQGSGGKEIICPDCKSYLTIPDKGNHACPNCGIHFYIDKAGRITFYESFGL